MDTTSARPAIRRVILQQLLDKNEEQGFLTRRDVADAAARTGVSVATMWRWTARGEIPAVTRQRYQVGEDEIVALHNVRGNASHAAHLIRKANGGAGPSERTIRRALAKQVTGVERAAMRTGRDGIRDRQLHLRFEAERRNQIWECDHKELSLRVLHGDDIVSPWATILIDAKSRAVPGWYLTPGRPTAESTFLCLIDAIGTREDGDCGGVPESIRWDNDPTFTADAITEFLATLGCDARPTDPYKPNQKGKIERFNRTVELRFSSAQPGFVHGARELNGDLYDRREVLLTWEVLQDAFDAFILDYNTEHRHRALKGQSPLTVWQADPHPVHALSANELLKALPSVDRVVHKDGIHTNSMIYVARSLAGLVGETVEVRSVPGDDRRIEVYRDGEWLCSAVPHSRLSDEETDGFFEDRGTNDQPHPSAESRGWRQWGSDRVDPEAPAARAGHRRGHSCGQRPGSRLHQSSSADAKRG